MNRFPEVGGESGMPKRFDFIYKVQTASIGTLTTLDNIFQDVFVSVMDMLLIYLFASMKLEKGRKRDYLALVLKIFYTMLFYKIG